ncbi:P63C domain-containing protein [Roseomonas sp. F4]
MADDEPQDPPEPSKQSRGGKARALRLTPQERSAIAASGARQRWAKPEVLGQMPEASSQGTLPIGDTMVEVYVLKDRRRLVAKRAMARAIGLKSEGGNAFMKTLSGKTIGSAIPPELWLKIENPIIFKPLVGDPAHGYEASVLIEVCDVLMRLRGKLGEQQAFLAQQAETIIRAAAKVGIIALIDEATGFIEDKRREEYRELWQAFVLEEAAQWKEAEFPEELFNLIYKLYNLKRFDPKSTKHPKFFPKVLRKYVYEPLANSSGAILQELDLRNPVVYANGGRRYKLWQFLSEEVGLAELRKHIWKTVGIGQSVSTKEQFDRAFYKAFPAARPLGTDGTPDLFSLPGSEN